jgi:hypothetical protein
MANGGITAEDVINLGEFSGPLGAPRGKAGGQGIITVGGGARPPGGRTPPGRGSSVQSAAARARAAAKKLRPTRGAVKRGGIIGGALGAVAAGAAVFGGGAPSTTGPPTLRQLTGAFTPRGPAAQRAAFQGATPKQSAGRAIRETATAARQVAKQQGITFQEAGGVLRQIAPLVEARRRLRARARSR